MNFENLLSEGKIEKVQKTKSGLEQPMKDLEFAKNGLETRNYGRVMAVVYEAVLMASNELMNFMGYRAVGKEHHKHVFEFLKECKIDDELVGYFNRIRVKRNNFVYRGSDEIGRTEAEDIIKRGEEFVQKIRTFVQKIRTVN